MSQPLFFRRKRIADVAEGLMREFGDLQFAEREDIRKNLDALFEIFAAYCIVSQYYSAFESDYSFEELRSGETGDLGVDGYAVIVGDQLYTDPADVREATRDTTELDVHFIVVQARRRRRFEGKVFTDVASNLVDILSAQELALRHGPRVKRLHECAAVIFAQANKFHRYGPPRLSFWYASLGSFDETAHQAKIQQAKGILKACGRFAEHIEVKGAGAQELRVRYHKAVSAGSAAFQMPHHVEVPAIPGVDRAFFGVLPARTVVQKILMDEDGNERPYLVEGNMRDYLVVSDVNSRIRATLAEEDERDQFAVLNNGITIVTRDLAFMNPNFDVKDPQIVNGWQTCNVLREVLDEDDGSLPDSVMVPVRIIHSTDERLIRRIVEATNRQTALTTEGLRSRDDFQSDLEDYFISRDRSEKGLRYERRLRQYGKKVSKSRLVTPRRLAQAYAAMWLDKPHVVTRYKALMTDHGEQLFQRGDDPLLYYTAAYTWHKISELLNRSGGSGGIPALYRPAQFHLLTGVKLIFLGEVETPKSELAVSAACEPMIQFLADPGFVPRLARVLEESVLDARDSGPAGSSLGDEVRTEAFALRFRQSVLRRGRDPRAGLTPAEMVRQSRHRRKESSDV